MIADNGCCEQDFYAQQMFETGIITSAVGGNGQVFKTD